MNIEDQSHEILVKIWVQFMEIIYDGRTKLVSSACSPYMYLNTNFVIFVYFFGNAQFETYLDLH